MFPFQRLDNVNGDLPDYHFQCQIPADGLVGDGKEMKMTRHAHRMYGKMPDCLARCRQLTKI